MAKAQLNLRVSDLTRRQLEELGKVWGTSQTETITVIIDRVHQQEIAMSPQYMTVDERRLYEAVNSVKLPPQTDEQRRAALRRQAVEYDLSQDDRPMTMNNLNYMPPESDK